MGIARGMETLYIIEKSKVWHCRVLLSIYLLTKLQINKTYTFATNKKINFAFSNKGDGMVFGEWNGFRGI